MSTCNEARKKNCVYVKVSGRQPGMIVVFREWQRVERDFLIAPYVASSSLLVVPVFYAELAER